MSVDAFRAARDLLLAAREDYARAQTTFAWPQLDRFNWALDWFDGELAAGAQGARPALKILSGETETYSFQDLSLASSRLANGLRRLGAKRGDRVLLLLGNVAPLWIALLAAMKLGLVVIPSPPQLSRPEIDDRLARARAALVIADRAEARKFDGRESALKLIAVGAPTPTGWSDFAELMRADENFKPDGATRASDPFLLYFTSGSTARPKLVVHTHASYPIGHLTTMYGLGLKPGDTHLNLSSPGWAKHAWSNVFAPWNAGACAAAFAGRFNPRATLEALAAHPITSFCAPPTVWRQLVQCDLGPRPATLREICSSGEPLNAEVIETMRRAWGLNLRDSYGQTETTMMVANPPGERLIAGAMGRPLPGYPIVLLDAAGLEADVGEVALPLAKRPLGLTPGYLDDDGALQTIEGDYYRTGDIASRDSAGFLTYVGRTDDVFKSSDYRLSPFELESALIEHPAVVEAAVAPAPDLVRLTIPKGYVTLAEGFAPDRATALSIFVFLSERLAPYKRVRRIEFVAQLPKTLSGKIRRVELRQREQELASAGAQAEGEFRFEDFSDLK